MMDIASSSLDTGSEPSLTDLTDACAGFLAEVGAGDGLLTVFVPHATAGVVVVELGAGSEEDLLAALERLLPRDDRWRHRHGSPGHGADHVLPLLVSPSLTVPVVAGPDDARHVAVDRAARPERRQPATDRAAQLPARLAVATAQPPGASAPTCSASRAGSEVGSSHA